MDETEVHPPRDQPRLAIHNRPKQSQIRARILSGGCVVAIDRIVREASDRIDVAARGEILEGSHPQMACGDAGQYRPGQPALAVHGLASRDSRKRPRGRDPKRVHRLADEIFAQNRSKRSAPVAAPGERRQA